MTQIIMYGALAAKYGRERNYAIRSASEAIKALDANIDDFRETIENMELKLLWTNTSDLSSDGALDLDIELLPMKVTGKTLHIIPMPAGAAGKGKGLGKILLGVAVIATAIFAPAVAAAWIGGGATAATTSVSFLGLSSGTWGLLGLNMVFGGAALMTAPSPGGSDPNDKEDSGTNFLFNSMVNVAAQGHAVALIYGGPIRVGSVVALAGMDTDHAKVAPGVAYDPANNPDVEPFVPPDFYSWSPKYGGGDYSVL